MTSVELKTLSDAMLILEAMPQGGIGTTGHTLEELQQLELLGKCANDDSSYHNAQKAWLLLSEVIKGELQ